MASRAPSRAQNRRAEDRQELRQGASELGLAHEVHTKTVSLRLNDDDILPLEVDLLPSGRYPVFPSHITNASVPQGHDRARPPRQPSSSRVDRLDTDLILPIALAE